MPSDQTSGGASNEVDDKFRALLEGLRTTLPGAQVLLGFLLILPVQGLGDAEGQTGIYFTSLLTASLASVLLIAPSVHQRLRGISRHQAAHLRTAVMLANLGTIFLGVAIVSAVALATRVVLDDSVVVASAVVVAAVIAWSWLWIPLVTFRANDRKRQAN